MKKEIRDFNDLKWTFRFLNVAKSISRWSKDPSTKVGAVIINEKNSIVSTGYNGFPRSVEDLEERYLNREIKYEFVVHAELNALLNALYNGVSVQGCTLFVYGLPPCLECAKAIIQSGIKKIYYHYEDNERWSKSNNKAFDLLKEANVDFQSI